LSSNFPILQLNPPQFPSKTASAFSPHSPSPPIFFRARKFSCTMNTNTLIRLIFDYFAFCLANKASKSEKVFHHHRIHRCAPRVEFPRLLFVVICMLFHNMISQLFINTFFTPPQHRHVCARGGDTQANVMSRGINCIDACDELPLLRSIHDHETVFSLAPTPHFESLSDGDKARENAFDGR
jgi:hypothetical protein